MPSIRALSSVAHDTVHHAVSGMSWLHPHAGEFARSSGLGEVRLDLLLCNGPLVAAGASEQLQSAAGALRAKFFEILEKHGFARSALGRAEIVLLFPTSDPYYCVGACRLETVDGRTFEKSCASGI
jgi:hypothetical protein